MEKGGLGRLFLSGCGRLQKPFGAVAASADQGQASPSGVRTGDTMPVFQCQG